MADTRDREPDAGHHRDRGDAVEDHDRVGQRDRAERGPARPHEEQHHQQDVHDEAGDGVEADARHRDGAVDAGLLEEARAERHPADPRGCERRGERRRDLRPERWHRRQSVRDRARERERGRDVGDHRHREREGEPGPVRVLHLAQDRRDIGELGDEEVRRERERPDGEHGALVDPVDRGVLRLRDRAPVGDGASELGEEPRVVTEGIARRRAQCTGLDERQGRRHRVATQRRHRAVDGPGGTDDQGERGEELGEIGIEHVVGRRDLAEAEVDDPRVARGVEAEVGEPEVAVGDAVGAQDDELRPHAVEHRVVEPAVVAVLEVGAVDEVVREQHRLAPDLRDRAQAGRAHPDITRLERDEGLVLHDAAQRRERPLVADVLEAEEPVGAVEEIGRTVRRDRDTYEQPARVRQRRDVPGPRAVPWRGLEVHDREPRAPEGAADRGPRWDAGRVARTRAGPGSRTWRRSPTPRRGRRAATG